MTKKTSGDEILYKLRRPYLSTNHVGQASWTFPKGENLLKISTYYVRQAVLVIVYQLNLRQDNNGIGERNIDASIAGPKGKLAEDENIACSLR